ncbi:kinase-like domain-containing protein [Annulohypoxylon maeteangense]|uniref:kinase-like domain-containing protein n=1 Tax=Annulohypoxylon maeteangense TaxID=1927788 RepID=UPI0020088B0D|nr:kinase-like domain-containing protein [Annulohypoxylon maeteangense]KAI0881340.1 kinase-like domain-containing protein [Annulohypoxylon maeteangense]
MYDGLPEDEIPDVYEFIENVEFLERYCPGGYHPIHIGERLIDRYQISAVKIGVADAEYQDESNIWRLLTGTDSDLAVCPAQALIPKLLDEFDVQGPNGTHRCLVITPARTSISDTRDASSKQLFQPSVARAIAAQLIQAVVFLHSRDVVHADLHEGNVLLRMVKPIDGLAPDELYEKYGYPEEEKIERADEQPLDEGVPTYAVKSIWPGAKCEEIGLDESSILLSDFGESFLASSTVRSQSHTPLIIRPPEQLLEPSEPFSFPADIWALACTIFSILGQRALFETYFPDGDRILKEHVRTLGRPPIDWCTRWRRRHDFLTEEGLERTYGEPVRDLEARVQDSIYGPRKMNGMDEAEELEKLEKAALIALLRSMLSFRPEDRPTARQVAESEWMIKWALPELRKKEGMSAAEVAGVTGILGALAVQDALEVPGISDVPEAADVLGTGSVIGGGYKSSDK